MILKWLLRLLGFRFRTGGRNARWPSKEQIQSLPWFEGLPLQNIVVVDSKESAVRAEQELRGAQVLGFDTESKPTFKKGEVSTGPHVAQFSTPRKAFVLLLHDSATKKLFCDLLTIPEIKKVGFGLNGDFQQIRRKFHIEPKGVFDLEQLFSKKGYGKGVGAKVGVALAFKRRLQKSRRIGTSNWMNTKLTHQQIIYAANDAYAAIRVYEKISR